MAGMMTGAERTALAAARRLREFTIGQLSAEAGVAVDTTRKYLRRWRLAGLVTREGEHKALRYIAMPDPVDLPPAREQSPERNMWTAMRKGGVFSARDLALQASTDSVAITEEMAARYIRALLPAGYLRVMQRAVPGRRPAVYRVIRNTGPLPPRECRVSAVWDANEDRWSHLPEAPQ